MKKKIKTMNIKMAINSQLSTTESKKTNQANNQNRNRIINMEITWRVISWEREEGRMGEKVQGLKNINWDAFS